MMNSYHIAYNHLAWIGQNMSIHIDIYYVYLVILFLIHTSLTILQN